jgi:hypothetical protein
VRFDDAGYRKEKIGMPDAHAAVFKSVAAQQRSVIVSRATGPTCLQLLEQGYDTKGFRVHAKSCDWGPMAGFVLRDPRLNKKGTEGVAYNTKEHKESLTDRKAGAGWVADTVPLKLFPQRVDWLLGKGREGATINARLSKNQSQYEGEVNENGVRFAYSLRKEFSSEGVVWGVYIEDAGFKQAGGTGKAGDPLLAMTNPRNHRSWPAGDFRNAVTGDYDLFTIWPHVADYDHDGDDRRVLGGAQNWTNREHIETALERNYTVSGQGTKLGNMTNRVYMVCQLLNSGIGVAQGGSDGKTWGPFPRRMVCWHSDETTRPFVSEVDLPLIAFAPSRVEIGIETITDFKQFIGMCQAESIHVTLGEGWTLNPAPGKQNRLGTAYARLVPKWMGGQWKVPDWYNR